MHNKTISVLALLAMLAPASLSAQIISSWSDRDTIVTNMSEGLVNQSDYTADGIIMSLFDMMEDYDRYDGDSQLDLINRPSEKDRGKYISIKDRNGLTLTLPTALDENGIDLFLLTREGIYIYLAMDSPVYHQEPDDELIKWIRYYAYEKRRYTKKLFARYDKWSPVVKKFFRASGVPEELAEICLIESGCTYSAKSPAGALGMWQIMPDTGRHFGMTINQTKDERLDPVISTQTAVKILKSNYKRVGEWTLAMASYNCGAGRILSNKKKGLGSWNEMKLLLPKETQKYVPAIIAIHYVWTYRDKLAL